MIHKPQSKAAWAVRLVIVLAVVAGSAGAFSLTHQASGARAAVPVASPALPPLTVPNGTLLGTAGNDSLTAGPGTTIIRAGNGSDAISSVNGVRDHVDCGGGLDSVTADRIDVLRNCEFVVRVES